MPKKIKNSSLYSIFTKLKDELNAVYCTGNHESALVPTRDESPRAMIAGKEFHKILDCSFDQNMINLLMNLNRGSLRNGVRWKIKQFAYNHGLSVSQSNPRGTFGAIWCEIFSADGHYFARPTVYNKSKVKLCLLDEISCIIDKNASFLRRILVPPLPKANAVIHPQSRTPLPLYRFNASHNMPPYDVPYNFSYEQILDEQRDLSRYPGYY